jgi:hypothetical protein
MRSPLIHYGSTFISWVLAIDASPQTSQKIKGAKTLKESQSKDIDLLSGGCSSEL